MLVLPFPPPSAMKQSWSSLGLNWYTHGEPGWRSLTSPDSADPRR
jgi:hypothetical protein